MKDLKVPFAIVSFLLVQGAGAVWWASQVDGRVKNLETQSLNIAKENRRYIKEVVMPSYNISCLLYTSPSPRDGLLSRMPSSA